MVNPFVQSYLGGKTPIPCVACNRDVKFDFLLKRARALGAKLATGHYARVEQDGRPLRAAPRRGCRQGPELLPLHARPGRARATSLFPVGGMTKAEVRADRRAPRPAHQHKPESMEICFVPDGDYAGFVEKVAGPQPGGRDRRRRGPGARHPRRRPPLHRGPAPRASNLGGREPRYVQRIEPETNRVVVGPAEQRRARLASACCSRTGWRAAAAGADRAGAHPPPPRGRPGRGWRSRRTGSSRVQLDEPARAVTPGQAAVFYDGERVLGGGWIV